MGTVFLRGNSRSIEYRSNNGSIRRESVGKKGIITKTMAREILQKRERNVKLGKEDMLDSKIPNLEEFSKEYLTYVRDVTKKRSWKRDELCLRHIIAFYGNRLLSNIKPQDIDEYKASRLKVVSPATVNRELEVLRYLFNLADR